MDSYEVIITPHALSQLNDYISKFGAKPLPRSIHPYGIYLNGEMTRKIREVYDYEWTEDTLSTSATATVIIRSVQGYGAKDD